MLQLQHYLAKKCDKLCVHRVECAVTPQGIAVKIAVTPARGSPADFPFVIGITIAIGITINWNAERA